MKIKLLTTIFILSFSFINAQKAKRVIDSSQDERSNGIPQVKNFDVPQQRNMVAPYKQFNNLNFDDLARKDFKIVHSSEDQIKWIKSSTKQDAKLSWAEKIEDWNNRAAELLELNPNLNEFRIVNQFTDELDETHIKLHQYHNGIKVYNSEIILHAKNGSIYSQNGNYVKSANFSTSKVSVLPFEKIQNDLENELDNFNPFWNVLEGVNLIIDKDQWENELVIFNNKGTYELAYAIEVYPNLGEHFEYIVNASSGEVIEKYSTICNAHNHGPNECNHTHAEKVPLVDGSVSSTGRDLLDVNRTFMTYELGNAYYMIDASRQMFNFNSSQMPDEPVGVIWTIDMDNTSPVNGGSFQHVANTTNNWSASPEGVSAHFNAGQAYDYFKQVHGRESISGDGQNIVSFVNVADESGSSLGNAFWNGVGIFYGNGDNTFLPLGRGLDVAGHEMTHGVVQSTADLQYFGESGAINESMADVFGAMIDRDDWLIGEDVMRFGGALRSMSDPHNGAQTGDFNNGWQPKHYNERYTGQEDNGGVHINSGIPNHAFYLFALQVGKANAERVYYRALTTYLTRSSQFEELRYAIVQSANDLLDQSAVTAARQAFNEVGILGESEGDFQEDIQVNPGQDLLLFADPDLSNTFIINLTEGTTVFNPLSTTDLLSKPSITDDGSRIVFVGTDNQIHLIDIDWSTNPPTRNEQIISQTPEWANIVISKDGTKLAGLLKLVSPESDAQNRSVWVRDNLTGETNLYELENPTYTEGISTGDVVYADALEFDVTGRVVMFDALNRVNGATGDIEFWDIGFLDIWNENTNSLAFFGQVDKLFGSLPEGISVGNPTYSKNSPFIIAFDYIEDGNNQIIGVNIETSEVGEIFENISLGYPNYSRDDELMVFDDNVFAPTTIGILALEDDKINLTPNSSNFLFQNGDPSKWPVWFSNGDRVISDIEEIVSDENVLTLSPNPASNILNIQLDNENMEAEIQLEITDISGRMFVKQAFDKSEMKSHPLDISNLVPGVYILNIRTKSQLVSKKFIKQ